MNYFSVHFFQRIPSESDVYIHLVFSRIQKQDSVAFLLFNLGQTATLRFFGLQASHFFPTQYGQTVKFLFNQRTSLHRVRYCSHVQLKTKFWIILLGLEEWLRFTVDIANFCTHFPQHLHKVCCCSGIVCSSVRD